MQEVLKAEMDEALGAAKGERTPERLGYRSGHYGRTLITRVGKLELRVPQETGKPSKLIFYVRRLARLLDQRTCRPLSRRSILFATQRRRPLHFFASKLGKHP